MKNLLLSSSFGLLIAISAGMLNLANAADFQKGLLAYFKGDYETAIGEWRPLAEEGVPEAQHHLGILYDNGQGVFRDDVEAVKWYRRAAEQGYASAQFNLGASYIRG